MWPLSGSTKFDTYKYNKKKKKLRINELMEIVYLEPSCINLVM